MIGSKVGYNPNDDLHRAIQHIKNFKESKVQSTFERNQDVVASANCQLQSKRNLISKWLPVTTQVSDSTVLFKLDKRDKNANKKGKSIQHMHYIEASLSLQSIEVIQSNGHGVVQIAFLNKAKIQKMKIKFIDEAHAHEWMRAVEHLRETVVKSRDLGERVYKHEVLERMNSILVLCKSTMGQLAIQNMDEILVAHKKSSLDFSMSKMSACAAARKRVWLSMNFTKLMKEAKQRETAAKHERDKRKAEHDHKSGCLILDQVYRKKLANHVKHIIAYLYRQSFAPIEARYHNLLDDAINMSVDLIGRQICGTRGLALGHLMNGLYTKRMSETLIIMRTKYAAARLHNDFLYNCCRSHAKWLQQKEIICMQHVVQRWRRSVYVSQVQYEGLQKWCRHDFRVEVEGILQRWHRYTRRLCDIDKAGWTKISNVVESIQNNMKGHALLKLQRHTRGVEAADLLQTLHNTTMVNDVLEQTFDAAPIERFCHIFGAVIRRHLYKKLGSTLSRMRLFTQSRSLYDKNIIKGVKRLDTMIRTHLIRCVSKIQRGVDKQMLETSLPLIVYHSSTKKHAAYRIGAVLLLIHHRKLRETINSFPATNKIIKIVNKSICDHDVVSVRQHLLTYIKFGTMCLDKVVSDYNANVMSSVLKCFKRKPVEENKAKIRGGISVVFNHKKLNWSHLLKMIETEDQRGDDILLPIASAKSMLYDRSSDRDNVLGFMPISYFNSQYRMAPIFKGDHGRRTLPRIHSLLKSTFNDPGDKEGLFDDMDSVSTSEIDSLISDFRSPIAMLSSSIHHQEKKKNI